MIALRLLPRGRRTGSPRSCSQRCTVRVPLPRYSATSFQEFSISLLASTVSIVVALTTNEITKPCGPRLEISGTKLGVAPGERALEEHRLYPSNADSLPPKNLP